MNKINSYEVVNEIVEAMHLENDPRTIIETGPGLVIVIGWTKVNGEDCRVSTIISRNEEREAK